MSAIRAIQPTPPQAKWTPRVIWPDDELGQSEDRGKTEVSGKDPAIADPGRTASSREARVDYGQATRSKSSDSTAGPPNGRPPDGKKPKTAYLENQNKSPRRDDTASLRIGLASLGATFLGIGAHLLKNRDVAPGLMQVLEISSWFGAMFGGTVWTAAKLANPNQQSDDLSHSSNHP